MTLDVTDASFEADVLDRSEAVPVLIDLWAPWCGPCRTLGPIIEQVVERSAGAVALVKVNIDENPRVASTFQVQSIPAVFAIYQRQIIDRFIGALPEHSVQEFVDLLIEKAGTSEADPLVGDGNESSLGDENGADAGAGADTDTGPSPAPAGDTDVEARLEALLTLVPGDDDARQQIVDLLETMDPEDPRRAQYRRLLSAKLF
ncbi:MAG: tetratricopeptide repeat protein [Acidimicrobiales bacterium]